MGTIPAGGNASNEADPFAAEVDPRIPIETQVPCQLFVNGTGYCDTLNFTIVIGELRATDPIPDGPRVPPLYWAYDDTDTLYAERPQFEWVELRGRGTQLSLGDDQTVTIDLPPGFVWYYYGRRYTQLSICSNGWIAPGYTTAANYSNSTLPASSMPPMVAVSWDDMYPPVGNGVWYFHDAANHRFIVEYDSVAYYSPQTVFDKFQLVIYDTTVAPADGNNVLLCQYLTANNYVSNTVGIQDPTATIAIQCLFNSSYHRGMTLLGSRRAIKYTTVAPGSGINEPEYPALASRPVVSITPNPFRTVAVFSFGARTLPVEFSIHDLSGKQVRSHRIAAGDGRQLPPLTWDGTDATGRKLPPGIYFYRVTSAGQAYAGKVVLAQ